MGLLLGNARYLVVQRMRFLKLFGCYSYDKNDDDDRDRQLNCGLTIFHVRLNKLVSCLLYTSDAADE